MKTFFRFRNLNDKFEFKSKAWLERVLIVGFSGSSKRAEINHSGKLGKNQVK